MQLHAVDGEQLAGRRVLTLGAAGTLRGPGCRGGERGQYERT
ncbi:hypothetical protein [Melaminivora sp.]|nr:hypothetical protein [Melaminivora sp.]